MLNINKLYNDYKLKILYPDENLVQGLKYQTISDDIFDMIVDIIDESKFDEDKYDALNDHDKLLYKMIVKKCNLAGDLNIRLDRLNNDDIEKLKEDFNVVMGQLESGNDNPELNKKAKALINEMLSKKVISNNQALNLLKDL